MSHKGGKTMSYFLKVTPQKGRTYLAIYYGYYNRDTKSASNRVYKSLGSIETLIEKGIPNPKQHFQKVVDKLNKQEEQEKMTTVTDVAPLIKAGYFPFKSLIKSIQFDEYVSYFNAATNFEFKLEELLCSLIYSRLLQPCSKLKTHKEVMPYLYDKYDFSYDQLMRGLGYLGNDYQKFTELAYKLTSRYFKMDLQQTYFDCTNFYFEINREDQLRRKGPSKENRKSPIVSMGLLLDNNLIPISYKLFPGNESEKPVMRDVLAEIKKRYEVKGRTITVADKGLNCGDNIVKSRLYGDGYIFSKSVKRLPEMEKKWVLLENGWKDVYNDDGTLHYRYKHCIDDFEYTYTDDNGVQKKVKVAEKRLVTYNPTLAKKHIMEIEKQVEKVSGKAFCVAKRSEFGDAGKYLDFEAVDSKGDKVDGFVKAYINQDKVDSDKELAGYNMLVTSELKMPEEQIYDTYHNLWRIEESFRIMKSDLDSRPVFTSSENSIKGHFLICYLSVFLERVLQFHILKNEFCSNDIFNFVRNFNLVKKQETYVNMVTTSPMLSKLKDMYELPIDAAFMSESVVERIMNSKFKLKMLHKN